MVLSGCESSKSNEQNTHEKVTKLYPKSLQVKEEYFLKDSIRDSLFQSWSLEGLKQDSGYYQNGERVGIWYRFDTETRYKIWNPVIKSYYVNGKISKEVKTNIYNANYKKGAGGKSSVYIKFYDSDTLQIDSVWDEKGLLNNNRIKYSDERPDTFFTYQPTGEYDYIRIYKGIDIIKKIHYIPEYRVDTFIDGFSKTIVGRSPEE